MKYESLFMTFDRFAVYSAASTRSPLTTVLLLIQAIMQSANHVVAEESIKSCKYRTVSVNSNQSMEEKRLTGSVVGARLAGLRISVGADCLSACER